jgi:threonine/homoserine/homoserine lactone efflux protein
VAASAVAAFWLVSALLIMVPGPDWAFTISAGLRGQPVVAAVGGLMLGYAAMTVVVAAGVGTLVAKTPEVLTALTVAGGLYLIWLGTRTLARPSTQPLARPSAPSPPGDVPALIPALAPARTRVLAPAETPSAATERAPAGTPPRASARAAATTKRATLVKGVGVSGLNPKGLLLFLALLPQFTSPRWSWPLALQLGFLGLIFMLSCGSFYLCVGTFARKALHTRPTVARVITRLSGAAMIVIGTLLLVERLVA